MNNVKIICIAGSIVLGSILLSGQAFGKAPSDLITLSAPKEPEGQHVSYDIDGSGSYYDSESDTTYYFVKGIVTFYSNHTKTFSLTSDVGETYELPAVARASAAALRVPLYQYLGGCHTRQMPVPMMNILNGGRHADNTVDLQEFMIMPTGAENMEQAIRMCAEVYQFLRIILKQKGLSTAVGDEGGFAPDLSDSESVLEVILEAVKKAGYEPGKDISIAIDAAASELYDEERGVYVFPGEGKMKGEEVLRDSGEMIEYYEKLTEKFPIVSIEDGLEEDDWEGWKQMTKRLGDKIQLVGDDLFVTNIKRLACGIKLGAANAILIKLNQIGTLSEALDAVEMAQKSGYRAVISHRSGESEDSFIADLAVATGAGQIKTGAPCRSDRNAKYNQLLRIHEALGELAVYENPFKENEKNC